MGLTKTQDWRYIMLKEKNLKLFLLPIFGINLMPTVLVYLGTVPLYYAIFGNPSFNFFTSLGMLIMIIATLIELLADKQMKDFRKDSENALKVMDKGLWAYSRHPNYLGEIVFGGACLFFLQRLKYALVFFCRRGFDYFAVFVYQHSYDRKEIAKHASGLRGI